MPLIAPSGEPKIAADLLAGEFRHTTSRAIAGRAADPQLHSHVVVTSAVDEAGQVRAIRDRTVYRAAREAGAFYRAALAEQLADQGDGYVIYASGLDETRTSFRTQLPATIPIRALDAKVQVSFDPATVADTASYDEPKLAPTGIDVVLVNGAVIAAGTPAEIRAASVCAASSARCTMIENATMVTSLPGRTIRALPMGST